jgi:transposase
MKHGRSRDRGVKFTREDLGQEELRAILERARQGPLTEPECQKLKAVVETLAFLEEELKSKGVTIQRLRDMLFGASTERTDKVLDKVPKEGGEAGGKGDKGESGKKSGDKPDKEKNKGHGRNGADAYTGAERMKVQHEEMHTGDNCPGCIKGKVYLLQEPKTQVRVVGVAPLKATVYESERLRCNLCGEIYTAPAPEGVGEEKYDESATAMVALLKYGTGLPFHRIERLQENMGIPLPATTQWDLVSEGADKLVPAHEELILQAAQGEVVHNDDTTNKVLNLTQEQRAAAAAKDADESRTGVFTSGIVATREGRRIALFVTGVKHAGENLGDVLARRAAHQPPPIQMSDSLSWNTSGDFETLVSHCLTHARRKYVDVVRDFPEEVRYVLEKLREVYRNDAMARQGGLSAEERLRLHQEKSGPQMDELKQWMDRQFKERTVEPNSGLGDAIKHMKKHWSELTLFLRVPGAPLDNNICERALKKVILHRKNALFFKTLNGARVGDLYMSLIHTAELNGENPWEYLVALQRHAGKVAEAPSEWMPWNYREALKRLSAVG